MGMLIGGMVAQIIMAFILPFIPLLLLFFKWARPFIAAYLLFLLAQWLVGQFIVATYAICGIAWLVTLVLVAHAYKLTSSGPIDAALSRLPGNWKTRIMDILEMLTDKEELQRRTKKRSTVEYIDDVAVATAIKKKLIGQDRVVDEFTAQIGLTMAEENRVRPVSTLFFAGPPGVGKTYAAKLLANALDRHLETFFMTNYKSLENATTLFGVGKGYQGSTTWGKIPATLRDYPEAVILLDEVEKAHKEVYDNFLGAFESGIIQEVGSGKSVSVNNAIFIFTANSKADEIVKAYHAHRDDEEKFRDIAKNLLVEDGFLPEFVDRFDGIFCFDHLYGLDVARVTALEIQDLVESKYGLEIEKGSRGINFNILLQFMERSEKKGSTNRDTRRKIKKLLAAGCVSAKQNGYRTVRIDLDEDDSEKVVVVPVK